MILSLLVTKGNKAGHFKDDQDSEIIGRKWGGGMRKFALDPLDQELSETHILLSP